MDRIPILLLSACASCICSAGQIHVQFYSPSIVRITKTPGYGPVPDKPIPVVTAKPMDPQPEEERTENGAVWRSAELVVKLDAQSGTVSFHDAGGKLIFGEKCAAEFPEVHYNGKKALVNIQKFLIADDEQIYGLGDWQNGQLDRRGATNRLMVDNVGNGMPYFCSSKGYSVYWDNTGPVWSRDVVGEALTMAREALTAWWERAARATAMGGGGNGTLIIFMLCNHSPEQYRQKQETRLSADGDLLAALRGIENE